MSLDYGGHDRSEECEARRVRPTNKKANTKTKTKSVKSGFLEDTHDGVDQNYFKSIDPANDDYIQPTEEEQQPQTQNGAGESIDPSVQKDMDQLGYAIKLKKLKTIIFIYCTCMSERKKDYL